MDNNINDLINNAGLKLTKQRKRIAKELFGQKDQHVTAEMLFSDINKDFKISLATIYNTVHAFKSKGYLKEISINSDKSYYDTNVSDHHHFFDESTNELIDLHNNDLENVRIKKNIPGKKIKSVEVLVKIENSN